MVEVGVHGYDGSVVDVPTTPPILKAVDIVNAPHLPPSAQLPAAPLGVIPLGIELGAQAGQALVLLSLERWQGWADLRFARIDVGATQRLARRVPPEQAWTILIDGEPVEVFDAVGRGDRHFSNGEVRLVPCPPAGSKLKVAVQVVPGTEPLQASFTI